MTPSTFRLGDHDRKRIDILQRRLEASWKAEGQKRKPSKSEALRWALRFTESATRPKGSPPFPYPETQD